MSQRSTFKKVSGSTVTCYDNASLRLVYEFSYVEHIILYPVIVIVQRNLHHLLAHRGGWSGWDGEEEGLS